MERKLWIDNLRGLCMLAILLDHTEIYYTGENVVDYNLYVVNALVVFFFISGYLMFRSQASGKVADFDLRHKVGAVMRTLVVPYLIFTTIIYVPKTLVHGGAFCISDMAADILGGQASWFIAALCVAELVFAVVIKLSKGNCLCLWATSVAGFLASIYLSQEGKAYLWQFDNAMQALLFLCAGYSYHKYERLLDRFNRLAVNILLAVLLVVLKIYGQANGIDLLVWHIHITDYTVFLLDISVCTLLAVQMFKQLSLLTFKLLPSNGSKQLLSHGLLCWTGRHTIVYYFLCGGVPLIVSKVLVRIGMPYSGNYLYVVLAFALVYVFTTALTYIVYRYLPFTVGKWQRRV